jgi:hypothetical protein
VHDVGHQLDARDDGLLGLAKRLDRAQVTSLVEQHPDIGQVDKRNLDQFLEDVVGFDLRAASPLLKPRLHGGMEDRRLMVTRTATLGERFVTLA